MKRDAQEEIPSEFGFVGDMTDRAAELTDKLLSIPVGGECTLYFDSPGGNPYSALSMLTIMRLRSLKVTGIVTGECSSAAVWPLAGCQRRLVTPYSVLLFHPMRWQSEEHVQLPEAAEWARHFHHLEQQMDLLLAETLGMPLATLQQWLRPGRYVTGPEFAAAGLAELIDLSSLPRKNRVTSKRSR